MTDPELDQLAALWRRPDEAERAMFEKMARKARLQARLTDWSDALLVLIIAALLTLVLLRRSTPTSTALAVLLFAGVLWYNWRRRDLRRASLALDTADRHAFIQSSLVAARAKLRNAMVGLFAGLALALLMFLFVISAERGAGLGDAVAYLPTWAATGKGMLTIFLFIPATIWTLYLRRRAILEIERFEALERAYEEEAGLDEEG